MKYFHRLIIFTFVLLNACKPTTLDMKAKANTYFKEILHEKTDETTFYIIIAPTACMSCFYPYMEYFFEFAGNKKFKIITSEMNKLSIEEHYSVNKFNFIIPKDEDIFSKQAFLKSQFCITSMKENEIQNILIVDSKNIFELKKYFTDY